MQVDSDLARKATMVSRRARERPVRERVMQSKKGPRMGMVWMLGMAECPVLVDCPDKPCGRNRLDQVPDQR